MAKAGRNTAVIERKLIGGSCPNTACLPARTSSTALELLPCFAEMRSSGLRQALYQLIGAVCGGGEEHGQ